MKKIKYIGLVLLLAVGYIAHSSGISLAAPEGVSGSLHDMSITPDTDGIKSNMYKFETKQTCVFCHTPHGANPDVRISSFWAAGTTSFDPADSKAYLLWNRDLPQPTTYNPYDSTTMVNKGTEIWAYSLMCLSCHDGVTAINVLHNSPNDMLDLDLDGYPDPDGDAFGYGGGLLTMTTGFPANPAAIGYGALPGTMYLEDDHPISVDYTVAQTDAAKGASFVAPTIAASSGYVSDQKVRLFPLPSDPTQFKALECSTCHDVHNEGCIDGGCGVRLYQYPFLTVTNKDSYLCTRCHIK